MLQPGKVRRHGGCLTLLGYPLLLGGILGTLLSVLIGINFVKKAPPAVREHVHQQRAEVVRKMQEIRGLPPHVIDEFQESGRVQESTLKSLPFGPRLGVGLLLLGHGLAMGRAAEQGKAVAGIVFFVLLVTFVLSVMALLLGLVLTARRRVWSCPGCSTILDRR